MCDCPALRARCETLEEENRQLRADLFGSAWEPPAELRLTRVQTRMLQLLMRHERPMDRFMIFDATRGPGTSTDYPSAGLIQALVCQLRRKMARYSLEIESIQGRGYLLVKTTRQRLLNWNTQHERSAA